MIFPDTFITKSEFILIAITPVNIFEGEVEKICNMLDTNFDRVHIRHPQSNIQDLAKLIETIPQKYYRHLSLHDHHSLAKIYPDLGIHLNARNSAVPQNINGKLSMSCHSIPELDVAFNLGCNYCFLSPIFDSISKPMHKSAFALDSQLQMSIENRRVIALGGVDFQNIETLKYFGFAGAAMLGSAWNIENENIDT